MVVEQIRIREGLVGTLLDVSNTISGAQKAADEYNEEKGTIAYSMPVLLHGFPYGKWMTANSEDYSGIDIDGKFGNKGDCVVATRHGGKEGKWGLLTPDIIQTALDMNKTDKKRGLNKVYAAVFRDLYKTNVLRDMLNGGIPDGRTIAVFSYDQLVAGECPRDGSEYVVVRPLSLAKKTDSGYRPIARLVDEEGKVIDSQVITYSGGVQDAQFVIDNAKWKFRSGNLGVWHPFNVEDFDPEEVQGRVLLVGDNDYIGLGGDNFLNDDGRFLVGVAPEAHDRARSAEKNGNAPLEARTDNFDPKILAALQAGQAFEYNGILYVPTMVKNLSLKQ